MSDVLFEEFSKIPRLRRGCVITEKIDGTNAQVHITDEGEFLVGSRTRYITPKDDNYGFAKWVPGFMKPEGIIIYHAAARSMFKVTLEKDEEPKGVACA